MTATAFQWHRPEGVGTSLLREFTEEAVAAIGAENTDLLAAVDAELNAAPESTSPILDLAAGEAARQAEAWAAREPSASASGTAARKDRYLAHLAFRHELAYRRIHGPALFERQVGVTPCPDFLPCTKHQVHVGAFGHYRLLNRLKGWSSIATITGFFPLVVMNILRKLYLNSGGSLRLFFIVFGLWCLAAVMCLGCLFAARALVGRPVNGCR